MKKLLLLFFCLFGLQSIYAQQYNDEIHLKNGTIIRAYIYEEVPDKHIKVKLPDGEHRTYLQEEILKITKASNLVILEDYGGKSSFGLAIGTHSLIGIPFRYYFTPTVGIEVSANITLLAEIYNTDLDIDPGLFIAGGPFVYFGKYYKSQRKKVKLNGLALRTGYVFSTVKESLFAISWLNEGFRKHSPKKSFVFELGIGITSLRGISSGFNYYTSRQTRGLIYWKCHWNFYGKKSF